MAWYGMFLWYGMHGMAECDCIVPLVVATLSMVWLNMVWYFMVWYAWYGRL